jgi:hypothetical protein
MLAITQPYRPTLKEALTEVSISPDSHWTANLSKVGMTRISPTVIIRTFLLHQGDE